MKSIIQIIYGYMLAICICCATTSCKKLIEVPENPADKIPTASAFSDSDNVLNVMAGIYSNFNILDNGAAFGFFDGGMAVYQGLTADELAIGAVSYGQYLTPYYANSLTSRDPYLNGMWTAAYRNIYQINASLAGVEASKGISQGYRQRITGELKTLRAWTYFNLLNLHGGVPVITGTDYKVNAIIPRATTDKTYEFIIKDLEDALLLLTPDYPSAEHARPNLYVAKALLAKLYLYTKQWQKAATLSNDVIESGLYTLEADLNNIFLQGSTEAIWQYPTEAANYSPTNEASNFVPAEGTIPGFFIHDDLLNAFEPDDQRKLNWIGEITIDNVTYTYPYKYKVRARETGNEPIEGYMFLRLAEQYLIRAEARANLDQYNDAIDDLNVIRQRAGLTGLTYTDKQTLLDAVMHERRVELFLEWGNRWNDLKRTNLANTVFATKPNWQATDVLYPIPLSQLQNNPFLQQNPGY